MHRCRDGGSVGRVVGGDDLREMGSLSGEETFPLEELVDEAEREDGTEESQRKGE